MRFITGLALRRRSVTVLAIILVLAAGIFTYRTLPVELFPEIEFPLVTVVTFYPSANPDAVAEDVTAPIENAIKGIDGLDSMQSVSSENRSVILANFEFGVDMAEAENTIDANVRGIQFPTGVIQPVVGRIDPDSFPVLQLSVTGDKDMIELQQVTESLVVPAIEGVDGVFSVDVAGTVERQALISVDSEKMLEKRVSMFQVSQALRENSVTFPGGAIRDGGRVLPIKTTNTYESLDELRNLVVGFSGPPMGAPGTPPQPSDSPPMPVTLGDVADVQLGPAPVTSISRTNGKPSIGVSVVKDPDANTIDVTTGVLDALDETGPLPAGVEIVTVSNDGPSIRQQIETLEREAIMGLALAVTVVFAFFLTLRPSAIRGRPDHPAPDARDRAVDTAKHLHGRAAHELAGPFAQLHDTGRTGDLGRTGRGRQHRRARKHLPQHSERQRAMARRT